jgi:hypothetical protein
MKLPLYVGPNAVYPGHKHLLSIEEEALLVDQLFLNEGHHTDNDTEHEKRKFVYKIVERANSTVIEFELVQPTTSPFPTDDTTAETRYNSTLSTLRSTLLQATNETLQYTNSSTNQPTRSNQSPSSVGQSEGEEESTITQSGSGLLDSSETANSDMQTDACRPCPISIVILMISVMLGAKVL